MIEHMHGHHWATCTVHGCHWQGPLRAQEPQARDDEREHVRTRHPRKRGAS